jgi:DNA repair protein RadA/Sms
MYICSSCGNKSGFALGYCPKCNQSDTYVKEIKQKQSKHVTNRKPTNKVATAIALPEVSSEQDPHLDTGYKELNRVLGGGLVLGSVVILGGLPGQGKSTLLLGVADRIGKQGNVLYVSAEENERQIKLRAERLGINNKNIYLVYETELESILQRHIPDVTPDLIIVDSINKIISVELDSKSGSVSQIGHCLNQLTQYAKTYGVPILLVGQVTNDEVIKGGMGVRHDVDTVLMLDGENTGQYRIIRTEKNRFGNQAEVGVFIMDETGMHEVTNASAVFLSERNLKAVGSAIHIVMEGNRPIGIDVQAITSLTNGGNPSRNSLGINRTRLQQIVMILENHVGLSLGQDHLQVAVMGGLKIEETAVDVPVAMAIMSTHLGIPIPADVVGIGEIALVGDIKSVPRLETRIQEAQQLGFKRVICRKAPPRKFKGIQIIEIDTILGLAEYLFPKTGDDE